MVEKFKEVSFWLDFIKIYFGDNIISLIIFCIILFLVGKKAFGYSTVDPASWKKAFWIILLLIILVEAYYLRDVYQHMLENNNRQNSFQQPLMIK